jgi:hypothetical protein
VSVSAGRKLADQPLPLFESGSFGRARTGRGSGGEVDQAPGSAEDGQVMTAGDVEEFVERLGITAAAACDQDSLRRAE